MPTTGSIPLQTVIPGQLIASSLWNTEFSNVGNLMDPPGIGSYSNTDAEMQIQTNPFPGSVTSHATSLAGEIERIRYMLASILGNTYWYEPPSSSIGTISNSIIPVGGVIDYPSATVPNSNFHLADGTAINRALFPDLFTLIGTTFGVGDGSTTFNLPNYTDRLSITAGNLYALAATGGAITHTLVDAEVPSTTPVAVTITDPQHTHTATDSGHTHGITDPGHFHAATSGTNTANGPNFQDASNTAGGPLATQSKVTGVTVNSGTANVTNAAAATGITASGVLGGGGGAHSILNPYLAMFKMIRVI